MKRNKISDTHFVRKITAFTVVFAAALICTAFFFAARTQAAEYNRYSACAINAETADMRSFSSTVYDASYNKDTWVYHDTKGGDGYKPNAGDIIVYGQYTDGITYWNGKEIGITHVEVCVDDYDLATGSYGVIGGNMGESQTEPYYLGSKVEYAVQKFADYYQASYGRVFIYNIWEVKKKDVSENIVYSAGKELEEFESDPEQYRKKIFSLQGKRNWCDIFVSYLLQTTKEQPKGKINVAKTSDSVQITNENSLYSLEDAVYGIFKDKNCTDKAAELITVETGKTQSAELFEGTYYVKEVKASKGFSLDNTVYEVKIPKDKTVTVNSKEPALFYENGILIKKICGCEKNQCRHDLSGAEFKISYFDNTDGSTQGEPLITWQATVELNEETGEYEALLKDKLPEGTYLIEETKVPDGFIKDQIKIWAETEPEKTAENSGYVLLIKEQEGNLIADCGNVLTAENFPIPEETTTEEITEKESEETTPEETTIQQTTKKTPKTGDESTPCGWYVVLGIAALIAAAGSFTVNKRKEQ